MTKGRILLLILSKRVRRIGTLPPTLIAFDLDLKFFEVT